ncbi:efflux RND transporter periplasmic adaptor subunit [Ruegeria faecimaris]|uniref:RND family efflux transporter, MFP subunit n=1 Tax=Ruegeria faecimaris TaxID=686389 RepID=A0A521CZB1_9RHOB|nr:efflux RND transporter periplasmic adaptor subunit [Ruegeria faecimaris]SMO64758.1 RND family efflux transporter, MFP subunit [Ruegeria faecimaris]
MKLISALGVALIFLSSSIMAEEAAKPVKLMVVKETTPGFTRQFFGRVAARQTVDLAFQVAGQIVEMPVAEGFVIPKGELIAELDREPFQRRYDRAVLQKDQADRTLARLSRLRGTAASQVAVDDSETAAQLADIAVRDALYDLEQATLTAPFNALVSSRAVEAFTTVSAGTPIVRIHDMSELRIEVDVPEILFQRSGQQDDITITAKFPVSDEVFPLQIREFDAESSSVGQTFRIQFGLTPPEGLQILPGSSATVTVRVKDQKRGIFVPPTAIVADVEGALGVMVFSPTGVDQGTLRRVPVTIEPTETGDVNVLDGLSDGEEIVVAGGDVLIDGQVVRRFTGLAN